MIAQVSREVTGLPVELSTAPAKVIFLRYNLHKLTESCHKTQGTHALMTLMIRIRNCGSKPICCFTYSLGEKELWEFL